MGAEGLNPSFQSGQGLVIVYTGNGKGKTTAALGAALRAIGHGWKVLIVQFIKSWHYGELDVVERLAPNLEIIQAGIGYVGIRGDQRDHREHQAAARQGLALAGEKMASGDYRLVILDEANNAVQLGLLDIQEVLALVAARPAGVHLILTGRNAHPDLIAAADLVTEMREVKHPYHQGQQAQKGIEF